MSKSSSYKAKDIEVLEGLEPVRKRPGMYIGGTGAAGLHQLVRELLDNAIDEAMNGYATEIKVILHADEGSITVEDNGRGIPVDSHPKFKKPALELIFCTLHAGGKFSDRNYVSAGGLHGVGASVVNALATELRTTVWREGYEWSAVFKRGVVTQGLRRGPRSKQQGTRVYFRPDPDIFSVLQFDAQQLEDLVRERAYLNRGLKLNFQDEKSGRSEYFCFAEGVKSFLTDLLRKAELEPVGEDLFVLERGNGLKVETAFCWTEATTERLLSFVNGIATKAGGSHEEGFRNGLVKAVRNYLAVHEVNTKGVKLAAEDIREGLTAVLSVTVPGAVAQLQFQGQTKDRLNNPEIAAPVEALLRSFENELNSKPKAAAILVERMLLAAKARAAARSAQQVVRRIGVNHRLNLPGKLTDCSSNLPAKSELFIVEGDSAGGSTKQGRDRKIQAVFPLRGKVLNAVAAGAAKVLENRELSDLVSVLGCGAGDKIDLARLRYHKVIILTDADSDGMHIAALLMAFFFKCMRPLVENGYLYLGLAPLYRLRFGSGSKEETQWAYSDAEKEELLAATGRKSKFQITRFKGLGEMNPGTLWETTLNPRSRNLLRIQIDDVAHVEAVLENLLGKDASERYTLIQEHAHRLELNL